MYLSVLLPLQVVLFIEEVPVSTPYCLPSLLATANQISRTGDVLVIIFNNRIQANVSLYLMDR